MLPSYPSQKKALSEEDLLYLNTLDINERESQPENIPNTFILHQNYPNPFNPVTKICYEIPYTSKVAIKISDILGRETVTIVNRIHRQGYYEIEWDAHVYESGVYFYVLKSDNFSDSKKLLLIK